MYHSQYSHLALPWREPLELAACMDEPWWVLLYSGVQTSYSGRYSYLAHALAERIEGPDFDVLAGKLSAGRNRFDNAWFGYLGYGLKDCLEILTPDQPNWLAMPNLCMMRFHHIYQFDHAEQKLTLWSDSPNIESLAKKSEKPIYPIRVSEINSSMPKNAYLSHAAAVIEAIHNGDLYQANLTRKFMGEFEREPDAFALFKHLCAASPAPYSAFLRLDNTYVLSSSPELFLHIDEHGHMRTRPIKGTAPRGSDPVTDKKLRDGLTNSAKDRAENLMIVDLMRNDFSRVSTPGSIKVDSLFEVTTHASIHHMSSTITGRKREDCSTLEAVKACFPPGSMTGAPKIKAMNLCSEMERLARGIYSGAIGWFGGDGACELSVVIRTLIMQGKQFEFQVGGGIVADSTPEQELQEIRDKSKSILSVLGLFADDLDN